MVVVTEVVGTVGAMVVVVVVVPMMPPPSSRPIRVGAGPSGFLVVVVATVEVVGLVVGVLLVGVTVVVGAVAVVVVGVGLITALARAPSSITAIIVSARAMAAGEAAKARHANVAAPTATMAARVGSLRRLLALVTLSDFSPVPDPARTLKAHGTNDSTTRANSTLQVRNSRAIAQGDGRHWA